MPLNSYGAYTVGQHKPYDHIGNILPGLEYSEGFRPHGHFRPASWLPVRFWDKHFENWIVVMPGRPVSCDNDQSLVPSGLGLAGAAIEYTVTDVAAGVIDVRTGAPLQAAAVGTVALAGVTTFMGSSETVAIGNFLGLAATAMLQWAGDGSIADTGYNPAGYRQHNYNMQPGVVFFCDYVVELPLVPATTAAEALVEASWANDVSTMTALTNLPVAKVTVRTPVSFADNAQTDAATRFVRQVESLTDIKAAGDWHIDLSTGVVSVYKATAGFGAGNLYDITYSNYASAPTGAGVSAFTSMLGNPSPGDLVTFNADSNLVVEAGAGSLETTVGQVLEIESVLGKSALDKVRTAYSPAINTSAAGALPGFSGQMDQMPGTATGGVSDKVHYSGAADLVARINLITR